MVVRDAMSFGTASFLGVCTKCHLMALYVYVKAWSSAVLHSVSQSVTPAMVLSASSKNGVCHEDINLQC